MKSLEFFVNTTFFVFKVLLKIFVNIYHSGKSESKNSLKLLKNQFNCFHTLFKNFSRIYKNGKSKLQNRLKLLKRSFDFF